MSAPSKPLRPPSIQSFGRFLNILVHAGKAVAMTPLTTVIGFGSLIFTNHPGLAGIGKIIVLGMAVCLLLTITVLPAHLSMVGLCRPGGRKGPHRPSM